MNRVIHHKQRKKITEQKIKIFSFKNELNIKTKKKYNILFVEEKKHKYKYNANGF